MAETRIALVSGANRGIGLEIVRQLARRGLIAIIGARSSQKGRAAAEKLLAEGLEAPVVSLDVDDETSPARALAEAEARVRAERRQARAALHALNLALRADPHVRRSANTPASTDNDNAAGRLCCVVVDRKGERHLLTLGFATAGKRSSSPGTQPAKPGNTSDESSTAGALVTLHDDDVQLDLPELGAFAPHTGPAVDGEAVRIAGSGSNGKRGKVTKVRRDSILTTLEAAPGDSGAPVVNDRNELVGILWSPEKEGAIVLSIDRILLELEVTLAPPH